MTTTNFLNNDGVTLKLNDKGRGAFSVNNEKGLQIGEMEISVSSTDLVAYHTEVNPQEEGKGYAKKMFNAMLAYAREHQLHVVPLCRYVHAQFENNPEMYKDVWDGSRK